MKNLVAGSFLPTLLSLSMLAVFSNRSHGETLSAPESNVPSPSQNKPWIEYASDAPCVEQDLVANQRPQFCIGAEIYGSYSHIWVENELAGNDHTLTQYEVSPVLKAALPEELGWQVSGKFEWESTKEASDTNEAFVAFFHMLSGLGIRAGLIDVGGIDQGNEFMTNLGEDAVGDYGNLAESQPYFEISSMLLEESLLVSAAYAADLRELPLDEQSYEIKATNLDLVLEWELEELTLAAEYEYFEYDLTEPNNEDSPHIESEYAYGLGVSYTINEAYTPFINYGFSSTNTEDFDGHSLDSHEFNLGVDVEWNDLWAFSLGMEQITDNRSIEGKSSDDLLNVYGGVQYRLSYSYFALSLWHSNQKEAQDNDNIQTRLDLELGLVF